MAISTPLAPHAPGGGGTKFQPVHVGDVAEAIAASVTGEAHQGRTYELAGPKVYSMMEILKIVNRETMRNRMIWGMPFVFADIKAVFLQFLPDPPLTPDQVKLLKLDNVASGRAPAGPTGVTTCPTTS